MPESLKQKTLSKSQVRAYLKTLKISFSWVCTGCWSYSFHPLVYCRGCGKLFKPWVASGIEIIQAPFRGAGPINSVISEIRYDLGIQRGDSKNMNIIYKVIDNIRVRAIRGRRNE